MAFDTYVPQIQGRKTNKEIVFDSHTRTEQHYLIKQIKNSAKEVKFI